VQGAQALQPSRTKGPCGLTGLKTKPVHRLARAEDTRGRTSLAHENDADQHTHPRPTPDLYGRWLWRGGSTRSHPELGSENPLRGWYCRGHPVGEYGAAGLA
jgi:hypothetical protein